MASQRQQVRELVGPRHGGGWAASEDRQVRLGTAGPNVQAGPEWMLVSRTAFSCALGYGPKILGCLVVSELSVCALLLGNTLPSCLA